jgi:cysteinyl-tRNA synthetase
MLHIYNSLTREKDPLTPLTPGQVRLYVCGMTVYDYCHLGHARVMVVFDMVVRYLRARGLDVTYIRNITDIDDKIIKRAAENNEDIQALTGRFIAAMHEDERALGVLPPDGEPRATEYMLQIQDMIGTLVQRGLAYQAGNKDVYYHVRQFSRYGALSGKSLDDLRAGARVEIGEEKHDPLDFVLWKTAKPGEPQWASAWGPGRPGWHIECSAMSTTCLGNHFDIHGGGMDLKFPHHENEIAQTEGATGEPFVNTWMHVGFVRVNQEKMSKSLGNFFTVREVLKQYDPEVVRYFILGSHYRSPLDYSDESLEQAKSGLSRLYIALKDLSRAEAVGDTAFEKTFDAAMEDDFNTPTAVAVLFDLAHEINRVRATDAGQAARLAAVLRRLAGVLGLLGQEPADYLQGKNIAAARDVTPANDSLSAAETVGFGEDQIKQLMAQRNLARQARNFAESDRIRDALKAQGITLEDGPGGTSWRRQ